MVAQYPSAYKTWGEVQNFIDRYKAAHVNELREEVEAIQAELGLNPAGSKATLVERLAVGMADNGAIRNGTSFPSSPVDGQPFYKTDNDTFYVYDGATWEAVTSGGNSVFSWSGVDGVSAMYNGTSDNPGSGLSLTRSFLAREGSTFVTCLRFRYVHVQGVNDIEFRARLWASTTSSGEEAVARATIGGQTTTTQSTTSSTPTWYTASTDIDVSGLSAGTAYDGTIELRNESGSPSVAYMSAVTLNII